MAEIDLDLSRYQLGWHDDVDYVFKPRRGLDEAIVREMSGMKGEPEWMLKRRLKSLRAFENLHRICEEHLAGQYKIEVIDLLRNPKLAAGDQILAIPTLVRRLPTPMKRLIGDLSNTERLLVGLDLVPMGRAAW